MKKCHNDNRFRDSLELFEDFLRSDADGTHVGRLVHYYKNCLKNAAGVLGGMHVASLLAPQPCRVVRDVANVLHVVSAVGSGAVSPSYVLCASCCVDHQDLGLSVVYLFKAQPRCTQFVWECEVRKAQSATKALRLIVLPLEQIPHETGRINGARIPTHKIFLAEFHEILSKNA